MHTARSTFRGTADDQTLGTSLRSLLPFAGNTLGAHPQQSFSGYKTSAALEFFGQHKCLDKPSRSAPRLPALLDNSHRCGPVTTRHNPSLREATDGSHKWYFTALVYHYCYCSRASCAPQLSAAGRLRDISTTTCLHSFPTFAKSTQKPQPERLAPARSFSF